MQRSPASLATQIAQLQKNYGNQAVLRMLRSHITQQQRPPVQAKWLDEGKSAYRWDTLVDGVRWYSDPDGLMYYLIEDPDAIKAGNLEAYQQSEGVKRERAFWLQNSVIDFDILGGLDNSVVTPEHANDGVLDTSTLTGFKMSQFKDLYQVGDTRILSVSKSAKGSGDLLKEVSCLNKISQAGLRTPNARIMEVIHRGKKTQAILMDKVQGYFVDFHKISNVGVLGKALRMVAGGRGIDPKWFTEFGPVLLSRQPEPEMNEEIRQRLVSELNAILSMQEEVFINDLQAIVGPDGRITIIDPIWVGSMDSYVGMERESIIETYGKLRALVEEELAQRKAKAKDLSGKEKKSNLGGGGFGGGFGRGGFGGMGGFGGPSSFDQPPVNFDPKNSKFFT